MERSALLSDFFRAIANDPTIGVSHISLYCALLRNFEDNGGVDPLPIIKNELMRSAKISGKATFHKCISDLHSLGYIRYQPSHNYRKKSKVFLYSKLTYKN
ncbi:MAG: hypothetical protein JST19_03670 [Bacteroidetes bacterium]|nr:hypothetical protein [Bacteroidota bacterium]